jgi:hypothetical protein
MQVHGRRREMDARSNAATESAERELVITRIFDVPRSLVWKAWAEPERMARWAGPKGFTMTSCEMDSRPGGTFRMRMRSPEGTTHRARCLSRDRRRGAARLHMGVGRRRRQPGTRDADHGHSRRRWRQDQAHFASGLLRVSYSTRCASGRLEQRSGLPRRIPGASLMGITLHKGD